MIIYAIVNNLLSTEDKLHSSDPVWTLISPSAILQGGNPFFVPDFASIFEARLTLALRIGKLGKSIAPRFANRYVDAIAPCSIMIASDILHSLQQRRLPWTQAISYDRALAIGKFVHFPLEQITNSKFHLCIQEHESLTDFEWSANLISPAIDTTIHCISQNNTLKTGDIILTGISPSGPILKPGLRASLSFDNQVLVKFNIR